jgi:SAM-dependent methyltransferase
MNHPNILLILLLFTIFLIAIFIYFFSVNPLRPLPSHRLPSLPQTCLQSYDALRLHKSPFHISMVHHAAPANLNYWVENKTGFEIGGPSGYTFGSLGVYDIAAKVDVTNFAADTLWEKGLKDGSPFLWKNQPKGIQYLLDAVDLHGIPNELYDFVAASHVLEHIANPFKALLEWLRILRSGGLLILITPLKAVTFDHKRDIVRIEHLINDYHNQTSEADLSHLDEILRLHDLGLDPPAGDPHSFKARSEKNFQNRALHQHVYDQELLYYIFKCLNLDVKMQITWTNSDLIIGQKY